jgi:hypothetical protein
MFCGFNYLKADSGPKIIVTNERFLGGKLAYADHRRALPISSQPHP